MGEGWQYMRESMLKALVVPKTGMVVAIDVGEENNIHPQNKQVIGQRFALWALGEVYGKEVAETSGPLPQGSEIQGDKVIVSFRHASGLRARDGQLKGFTIAGPDQNFVPAQATIENDKVIVYSPDIKNPVAVRYAWSEVPECNLVNGAGLPASPFRTDGGN
jgi:sialate O-acetylesterase